MLLTTIALFGQVVGEEFSPDVFQRRTYIYFRIPLLGVQISPVWRWGSSGELEAYLTQHKFVPPCPRRPPRWHVATAHFAGTSSLQGDAHILCKYLDARQEDGELIWLAWTKDNATSAKALWPAVAQLAQQNLYTFVPELMRLAGDECEPIQLQQRIDRALIDAYLLVGDIRSRMHDHRGALEYYDAALAIDPTDASAKAGRRRSMRPSDPPEDPRPVAPRPGPTRGD
jgi:hypothetical protein